MADDSDEITPEHKAKLDAFHVNATKLLSAAMKACTTDAIALGSPMQDKIDAMETLHIAMCQQLGGLEILLAETYRLVGQDVGDILSQRRNEVITEGQGAIKQRIYSHPKWPMTN